MEIHTVLVTGTIYQEMEQMIDVDAYRQSFRFIKEEDISTEDLRWADAYVAFKPTADFDFYNIKWVHSLGAGVDRFLYEKEWKEDVLLTRTICSFGRRISQYCLSYLLKDLQRHNAFRQKQTEKIWSPSTPALVEEQKILIYGTGEIGRETAQLFSSLGAGVWGVSRSGRLQTGFDGVYSISEQEKILKEADVVINTLPLTHETYHLFGKKIFSQLNKAMFMNVGRGASIVEHELLDAVRQGNIRQAVLDVFEEEPLPSKSLLWEQENILITPHISAVTTAEDAVSCFLDTLTKVENNYAISNKAEPENGY